MACYSSAAASCFAAVYFTTHLHTLVLPPHTTPPPRKYAEMELKSTAAPAKND
ncbi:hypothetical protein PR003_g8977 [Phytophthora rubi]|uniref:Uncharacterized protein n=1 Tax=Phytophthora rubi TaxID=129364 RepID=A0A6A4FHI5_9STRA|nr:hypothetical protein PR003_g8977 [Phytophthora rubi]